MSSEAHPAITGRENSGLVRVHGTFFRAVASEHIDSALSGSRGDGRYSSSTEPTLYLSSSPEGVEAAMIKHSGPGHTERAVLSFDVEADAIADLRDAGAMADLGIDPAEAAADWQSALAAGEIPPSWRVRRALESAGAYGLIDPSRKRPGLWHLVLFAWNGESGPLVRQAK